MVVWRDRPAHSCTRLYIADGVSVMRRRRLAHPAGLPSVHLYPSDRVKPVSTRLPRLVARGYPADAPGPLSVTPFYVGSTLLGTPSVKTFTRVRTRLSGPVRRWVVDHPPAH